MLLFRELDNNMNVVWASPNDVCTMCINDKLQENIGKSRDEMNPVIARESLRGKLYGKKVFKLRNGDITLCEDHVAKVLDLLKPENV